MLAFPGHSPGTRAEPSSLPRIAQSLRDYALHKHGKGTLTRRAACSFLFAGLPIIAEISIAVGERGGQALFADGFDPFL